MAEDYISLIGEDGLKELDLAKKSAKELADIVVDTNNKIADMYGKLKSNKSFAEFNKTAGNAQSALASLGAGISNYEKAVADAARAEKQLAIAFKTRVQAQAAINTQTRNSSEGLDSLKQSVRDIVKELPSLSGGIGNFFKAIADKLPALIEQIGKVKQKNDELAASGQKGVPVWQQLAGSIFSWQSALTVGITLLVTYGDKIKDAVLGTTALTKAQKKFEEATNGIEAATRAAAGQEIAHIRVLEAMATSTDKSTEAKRAQQQAVDELQRLYPQTLKDYDDEAIKAGKAAGAINELTDAIMNKAMAQASEKKYAAAMEKVNDLWYAKKQAETDKASAEIGFKTAQTNFEKHNMYAKGEGGIGWVQSAQSNLDNANEALARLNKQLAVAKEEAKGFLLDSQKFMKEAGMADQHVTKPAVNNAAGVGSTNHKTQQPGSYSSDRNDRRKKAEGEFKLQYELQKKQLEQQAAFQKSQSDNEKLSLNERLDALTAYYAIRSKLITAQADYEKETGQRSAIEIETIEQDKEDKLLALTNEMLNEKLGLEQDTTEQTAAAIKKVFDELYAANQDSAKNEEKDHADRVERTKKTLEAVMQYETKAADFISELSRKNTEQKIADLDTLISKIDAQTNAEIDAIKKSANSAEQKQELIAEAEARAAARRQLLEQKQAETKRRQASFDKQLAVAKIFIDMFIGMAQEVADKGIAGLATGAAIGAYISGLMGVLSAVAVPQYAKGTADHPGGAALVAEAGAPEFVKEPGKAWELLTEPTLRHFARHTQVVPMQDMVAAAGAGNAMSQQLIYQLYGLGELKETFKTGIDRLDATIQTKAETTFVLSNGEWQKTVRSGNIVTTYINANLK